jgi:beta-glucanase (GH16 family)
VHLYNGNPADENDLNRRSMPQVWEASDFDPTTWHTYGFLWTPAVLRWYVDGRLIREAANTAFHWPMAITFTGEIHPNWFGTPGPGELPCTLQVDFLRVWQLVDER